MGHGQEGPAGHLARRLTSGTRSGDEALDRFLHRFAGQNQFRHYLGVTYVAVDGARILGFATVAPRHVELDDLPERARTKLPRYPVPVLGLARLAVEFYARFGFMPFESLEGQSEVRPRPTTMWLPIQVIKAASEPPTLAARLIRRSRG